jgi:glutaredoxin
MADKFDKDYLSTNLHISEWGKLLRLLEKGVASRCCVNVTVIRRAKDPGKRTMGNMKTACDYCIKTKRLCARLLKIDDVIKLAFFPLPSELRPDADLAHLNYWVLK